MNLMASALRARAQWNASAFEHASWFTHAWCTFCIVQTIDTSANTQPSLSLQLLAYLNHCVHLFSLYLVTRNSVLMYLRSYGQGYHGMDNAW